MDSTSHNFQNDVEGKYFFTEYLLKHNFKNIVVSDNNYEHWDIKGEYNGITYFFELKVRPILSTRYNDSIIQDDKLKWLQELESENSRAFIVNFFKDCFYILSINEKHEEQHWMCQKTNNWDRTRVPKTLISYPNHLQNRRDYSDNIPLCSDLAPSHSIE